MLNDDSATETPPDPQTRRSGATCPETGTDPHSRMQNFLLFTIYQVLNEFEDGIALIDEQNRVRWVNASMRRLFDLNEADVAGMPAGVFTHRFINPLVEDAEKVIATAGTRELHLRKPNGEECWLEYSSRPMQIYPVRNNRLEIYRKITRWKLTERCLVESEKRYRTLFEKGNDAILVFELSPESVPTRFVEANEVACRRLGYSRDELLARSPLDIATKASTSRRTGTGYRSRSTRSISPCRGRRPSSRSPAISRSGKRWRNSGGRYSPGSSRASNSLPPSATRSASPCR